MSEHEEFAFYPLLEKHFPGCFKAKSVSVDPREPLNIFEPWKGQRKMFPRKPPMTDLQLIWATPDQSGICTVQKLASFGIYKRKV